MSIPMTPADPSHDLARLFQRVHDHMRDGDGLAPVEALEELLKCLYLGSQVGLAPLLEAGDDEARAHALRGAWGRVLAEQARVGVPLEGWDTLQLSTPALLGVVRELQGVHLDGLPWDLVGTALRVFLSTSLRRGLGIYLTPDPVVRAVVEALDPRPGEVVLDPACGTGGFLLHTAAAWRRAGVPLRQARLWGVERNARLLRMARLNLLPLVGSGFTSACADSLAGFHGSLPPWYRPDSCDVILTNPPFGVSVSAAVGDFAVAGPAGGRLGSEVLFLERCLRLLRPGGRLGIVLPDSLLTNASLAAARRALDPLGRLLAVLSLPSETFAATGTQARTSVLFLRRRGGAGAGPLPPGQVLRLRCQNVGYDATGRPREGSDLPALTRALRVALQGGAPALGEWVPTPPGEELSEGVAPAGWRGAAGGEVPLAELVTLVRTGRTPPRRVYTEAGHFILKVGNLTGHGVDWAPRSRNFVGADYARRVLAGAAAASLVVGPGDILLTASAHVRRYIAAKADLVDAVPEYLPAPLLFVGELMLIRVDPQRLDPWRLLAFLRSPATQQRLQAMARGQTAHLMAPDVLALPVPLARLQGAEVGELAHLLQEEAHQARVESRRRREIARSIGRVFGQP